MINSIISGSFKHISISSNGSYVNTGASGAGSMRYYNNSIQVYDGYTWVSLNGSVSISLTTETEQLLDWVKQKRTEELNEQLLLDKYPALKSAKDSYTTVKQICEAEEKLGNINVN